MTEMTRQTMHRDHIEWSRDCDMWRDDIRAWQRELDIARAVVERLTGALRAYQQLLEKHAGAIRLNEQLPAAHEHVLKQQEQGYPGRTNLPTEAQHGREAVSHADLKATHEQIKRKYHAAMAAWRRLQETVDADDRAAFDASRVAQQGGQ